jgi:poly(3-hydroxybutyrate) depolymerase
MMVETTTWAEQVVGDLLAGNPMGGGLTDLLACNTKVSARLAATAIASGALYKDSALKEPLFSRCTPSHVLPIMEFHGNKDLVEHYDHSRWRILCFT